MYVSTRPVRQSFAFAEYGCVADSTALMGVERIRPYAQGLYVDSYKENSIRKAANSIDQIAAFTPTCYSHFVTGQCSVASA